MRRTKNWTAESGILKEQFNHGELQRCDGIAQFPNDVTKTHEY